MCLGLVFVFCAGFEIKWGLGLGDFGMGLRGDLGNIYLREIVWKLWRKIVELKRGLGWLCLVEFAECVF